ncbi:PadR family transcriptional regulator [Comamonas composti]|uniref:PadR family transcriptional regulator n=1 Tax=Comamonas composti TaxID=408558 RepID=UPI00040257B5|nr:PadR family transcriptional regulator [Comamonas composti]
MSLAYAILTALTEEPSTGAELLKRFDKSIGYFWNCTHQQIYRELKQLESKGLVTSETSAQKSSSFVYRIEPKGRAELKQWIEDDKNHSVIRDPFLVKVRALSNFDELCPERIIREKKQHHEEKLRTYEQIGKRSFPDPLNRSQLIKKMVLDAGIRREKAYIEWCEECLQILASLDSKA